MHGLCCVLAALTQLARGIPYDDVTPLDVRQRAAVAAAELTHAIEQLLLGRKKQAFEAVTGKSLDALVKRILSLSPLELLEATDLEPNSSMVYPKVNAELQHARDLGKGMAPLGPACLPP